MQADPRLLPIGRAVRRARRNLDISQETLGQRIGMHATHVSEIERGLKDIRLSTLLRVTEGLEITPAQLFTLADESRRS